MAYPPIEHIADEDVDEVLDRELRGLLSTCFVRPQDQVFRERRYWKEHPAHRWLIRNTAGELIAHVAAHDKTFMVQPDSQRPPVDGDSAPPTIRVAGIAEVCVHPAHRGAGHVKAMLRAAHSALEQIGCEFAALFGDPQVYRSSGYRIAENLVYLRDDREDLPETWHTTRFDGRDSGAFMWRPLSRSDWPEGTIDIRGPKF